MKFSSLTFKMNSIFSSMMGISSNAQKTLGAIGSNASQESPNSFWDTLLTIVWRTIADLGITIWETVMKIVYAIVKWVLTIIDFIFIFIRQIIGLNSDYQSVEELSEADLIFKFVFSDTVMSVIKGMIGFAILLIILFSIFAIVKSEYDYAVNGGSNSKGKILASGLRSLFLMILVPVIAIGGMILSNAILKSLYIATAGGIDSSLSSTIFVTAGYDANAYRRYANKNYKIPITFNFDEVGKNDNVVGWGADSEIADLDAALSSFSQSDVWNRGFTTFLMFYTDSFFQMDTVDRLNDAYRELGGDAVSSYHSVYDKGIYTKNAEYYVMADVIDYSIKSNKTLYIKTAEEVYESMNGVGGYCPIIKNGDEYTFEVYYHGDVSPTKYVHKAGAKDESDGAVFMIVVGEEVSVGDGDYVTRYSPLLSGEHNFTTDYHSRLNQPIVAKGMFEDGVNPTAIKEEDGIIKFYRDDLNVPTLVNLFPTISYELPEGATDISGLSFISGSIQAIIGVDITQFIPYVYFSFDVFNLFTKTSKTFVSLENGCLRPNYNFSQDGYTMSNLYKMSDFNMIIVTLASITLVGMLLKVLFGLATRVMDVTLLAITYPAVLSTMPLDDGSRFKGWVEKFIQKILSIYGVVIGINLVMLLFDPISELNLITPSMLEMAMGMHVLPAGVTARFLNELVSLMFTLVAFTMIESTINMVSNLVTKQSAKKDGLMADGEQVINELKKVPQNVANIVSGQFLLDIGNKAIDAAASLVPGGKAIGAAVGKVKEWKDLAAANKDIKDMKNKMKDGDTSGFETRSSSESSASGAAASGAAGSAASGAAGGASSGAAGATGDATSGAAGSAASGAAGGAESAGAEETPGSDESAGSGESSGSGESAGSGEASDRDSSGEADSSDKNDDKAAAGEDGVKDSAEPNENNHVENAAEDQAEEAAAEEQEAEEEEIDEAKDEAIQQGEEAVEQVGDQIVDEESEEDVSEADKATYGAKAAAAAVENEADLIKNTLLKGDVKGYFDDGGIKSPDQEIKENEARKNTQNNNSEDNQKNKDDLDSQIDYFEKQYDNPSAKYAETAKDDYEKYLKNHNLEDNQETKDKFYDESKRAAIANRDAGFKLGSDMFVDDLKFARMRDAVKDCVENPENIKAYENKGFSEKDIKEIQEITERIKNGSNPKDMMPGIMNKLYNNPNATSGNTYNMYYPYGMPGNISNANIKPNVMPSNTNNANNSQEKANKSPDDEIRSILQNKFGKSADSITDEDIATYKGMKKDLISAQGYRLNAKKNQEIHDNYIADIEKKRQENMQYGVPYLNTNIDKESEVSKMQNAEAQERDDSAFDKFLKLKNLDKNTASAEDIDKARQDFREEQKQYEGLSSKQVQNLQIEMRKQEIE